MSKKRIGVIGLGQWGPNQIRCFFFHPQTQVSRICDKDPARLKANQNIYPQVEVTEDYRKITQASDIDAVVITTPVSSHYEITKDALVHKKDVLCEKPLTLRVDHAKELADLAQKNGCVLMVGHVFLFNPGVVELKKLLNEKEVGRIYYLHAQRTNLGPVRADANAVYDLASHDLSIFNYLLDGQPRVVQAYGKCYLQKQIEDVAFITLEYPGNILAQLHVSWLDPKKIRQITVVGDKKMITWNDLPITGGPIEIFSKHVEREQSYRDFGDFHLLVKEGEIRIPFVKNSEPLKLQADHFVECLLSRKRPLADAENALAVMHTLEEIERLLAKNRL